MKRLRISIVAGLALGLSACGRDPAPEEAAVSAPSTTTPESPPTPDTPPASENALAPQAEAVVPAPEHLPKVSPKDLVAQAAAELRGCLARGAIAQIDFTEARLSLKLDPSGGLLNAFVDLNNRVLDQLDDAERHRVGVHTCPGGDQDSTHSADVGAAMPSGT